MARKKVFAIIQGDVNQPTIFNSEWDQIKPLVTKVSNAKFRGFLTVDDAEAWMRDQKVDNYVVDGASPQEPEINWDSILAEATSSRSVGTNTPPLDTKSTGERDKTPPASASAEDFNSNSDGNDANNRRRQQSRRSPAQLRLTVDLWDQDKLADVLRSVRIS